jgi:peptide/nickel transport system substrate-binding protein
MAAAATAGALVLAGCGSSSSGAGSTGGEGGTSSAKTLSVGIPSDPTSLDYQAVSDASTETVTWSINEGLFDFDAQGNLVPLLASEVPTFDASSPDKWTIHLRSGVTFTDGEAFNAKAVKTNVDRVLSAKLASPLKTAMGYLSAAKVIDGNTVELETSQPDPILPYRLATLRLVAPNAAAKAGYAQHPVGTGPYEFVSWKHSDAITLKANPDYWGQKAGIGNLVFKIIPDDSSRLVALKTGEIQMDMNITPDQAAQAPQVLTSTAPASTDIGRITLYHPPYDNVKFRQALNYAINQDAIAKALYDNGKYAVPSKCTIVPPDEIGYTDSLSAYPYDPAKAKQLLSEVHLPKGFAVHFDGSTGIWPGSSQENQLWAQYWRAIGLKVDMKINQPSTQLALLNKGGMGSTGGVSGAPDLAYTNSASSTMHASRQIDLYLNRDGFAATIGKAYPQLDQMIKQAYTSPSEETRTAGYDKIAKFACDNALFVFGLAQYDLWGAASDISYSPVAGPLRRVDFNRVTFK